MKTFKLEPIKAMKYKTATAEFMLPQKPYGRCAISNMELSKIEKRNQTIKDFGEVLLATLVLALLGACTLSLYVAWDAVILN